MASSAWASSAASPPKTTKAGSATPSPSANWSKSKRPKPSCSKPSFILKKTCVRLHYNLACYACLLGKKPEAKRRLVTAFKMDKVWKQEALDDPDLKAMRAMITAMK